MEFAGGPSIVGVSVVLGYATQVLSSNDRAPRKGWLALGAGALVACWMVLFLSLAAGTVFRSLGGDGPLESALVLLGATWLSAGTLVVVVLGHTKAVCRYLSEAYPADEGPSLLTLIRRWVD